MKSVAICVGHTDGTGAISCDGIEEWDWNNQLALALKDNLVRLGYKVRILYRDGNLGYGAAMRKHARAMKEFGADLALELHFNSAGPTAKGFEFLYWWGSKESKRLALSIAGSYGNKFKNLIARGINGVRSLWFHRWNEKKAYSGRGGGFCYLTPCPAVICEPVFASNIREWIQVKNKIQEVADGYTTGIVNFLNTTK